METIASIERLGDTEPGLRGKLFLMRSSGAVEGA